MLRKMEHDQGIIQKLLVPKQIREISRELESSEPEFPSSISESGVQKKWDAKRIIGFKSADYTVRPSTKDFIHYALSLGF